MNPSAGLRSELIPIRVGKGGGMRSREGMVTWRMTPQVSGLGDWMERGAIGHDREYRGWCRLQGKLTNWLVSLCHVRCQRLIQGSRFNWPLYRPVVLEFKTEAELKIKACTSSVCFTLLLRWWWSAWENAWSGEKKNKNKWGPKWQVEEKEMG